MMARRGNNLHYITVAEKTKAKKAKKCIMVVIDLANPT